MSDNGVIDYKETLKNQAEELLVEKFPIKIVQLNALLTKLNFADVKLTDIHQDVNIPVPWSEEPRSKRRRLESSIMTASSEWPKVCILPNGPSPSNGTLIALIHKIKPHIRQLFEDSNLLKMWISFLVPKIEDGHNFGVSIQSIALTEIQQSESTAEAFLEEIAEYFVDRAKIVSKVAKYPQIDDYRRAVRELDEKQYLFLWLTMCEVRNRYCVLHDLVTKNFDKIKNPRTSNVESLY